MLIELSMNQIMRSGTQLNLWGSDSISDRHAIHDMVKYLV